MPVLVSDAGSYLLHERAARYEAAGAGWLSVKLFAGGSAQYAVGGARYLADPGSYLILNHGQPYAVSIDAEAPVESFCLFFAPGALDALRHSLTAPLARLLDDPLAAPASRPFVERTYPQGFRPAERYIRI